jgi:cytochrome c2
MKLVLRFVAPLIALLAAACGTVATPVWSEQAQETQVALAVTSEHLTAIAPTATNTPIPEATATPFPTATPLPATPTPAPTEPPTATAVPPTAEPAAVTVGNADNGKVLFETFRAEVSFACATCHRVDSEERLIGPGLLNIANRIEGYGTNETVEEYLHHSIVAPNDFVVADYPAALMPQTYGQIFTEAEISDLIAYVLSLGS